MSTRARRGDVVAIVTTSRTAYVGGPSETRERVELAIVASVTRDGTVKRADILAYGDGSTSTYDAARHGGRVLTMPDDVAGDALLAAYSRRRYPTAPHSDAVPPFDSMADARAFIREYGRPAILTL